MFNFASQLIMRRLESQLSNLYPVGRYIYTWLDLVTDRLLCNESFTIYCWIFKVMMLQLKCSLQRYNILFHHLLSHSHDTKRNTQNKTLQKGWQQWTVSTTRERGPIWEAMLQFWTELLNMPFFWCTDFSKFVVADEKV